MVTGIITTSKAMRGHDRITACYKNVLFFYRLYNNFLCTARNAEVLESTLHRQVCDAFAFDKDACQLLRER